VDPVRLDRSDSSSARPLRVLAVARWFPSHDDPGHGSFVADQAAALSATGVVEARAASFEPVTVRGTPAEQEEQRRAAVGAFGDVVSSRPDVLSPRGAAAPPGIPVARLPVISGADIARERARQADDHAAVLGPFARGPGGWNGRPDVIHAHTAYPDGAAAAQVAGALGCPLVITEHSSGLPDLLGDPAVRAAYVRALEAAARIIAVSEPMAMVLREIAPGIEERLRLVPNPVPLDVFAPPAEGERRRPRELLWVGTRSEAKGTPLLLRAFAMVRQRHPGIALRMIGRERPAGFDARLQELVTELGIVGAVSFDPPADRQGVAEAMRQAGVFVHPSRGETFGMVAAEALASGLPVVATRSGGVDWILGHEPERFGALVPVDDVEALARAIDETLEHRDRVDSAELRRYAAERFGPAVVAGRLLEIYAEAGAGPAPGPAAEAHRTCPATCPIPPALIVGFNRTRAARLLGGLPAAVRATLTLVTAADDEGAAPPAGLARILEVDLRSGQRAAVEAARAVGPAGSGVLARGVRALRHPRRWQRSRWARTHPAEMRLLTAGEAVRAALASALASTLASAPTGPALPAPAPAPPDLVCLDGFDVLAVGPLLRSGEARLCPGIARWLADQAQSRENVSTTDT
jgi:glycosyltransferase involved in cell wall biosynthesis